LRTAVVLPAPLGPSNPRIVPPGTARSRPSRAVILPNRFTRPDVRIISVTAAPFASTRGSPLLGHGRELGNHPWLGSGLRPAHGLVATHRAARLGRRASS